MATFTCITENRDTIHLTQHVVANQIAALQEHIAALPYDDDAGPFDDELEWLQGIAGGHTETELTSVEHCRNTWMWLDGARYNPQYITYIVKTDINP